MTNKTPNKTPKKKKLTFKEKRFAEEYVENKGNRARAVISAGYNIGGKGGNPKNRIKIASEIGTQNLEKLGIQKTIEELLESEGITQKQIIQVMKELLLCDDKRVNVQILDQLHKIKGTYSPERKMLLSKSEIFQEIKELPEEIGDEPLEMLDEEELEALESEPEEEHKEPGVEPKEEPKKE